MNYKYLIDTNVITDGHVRKIIETDFFKEHCMILDEIAFELQDTTLADQAKKIAATMNGKVLPYLMQITDEMVKLGILKTDEGNGEALLVAWGMMVKEASPGAQLSMNFMREEPVIVTNETKVIAYAKTKGLNAMKRDAFCKLIQSSIT